MGYIRDEDRPRVAAYFAKALESPVTIHLFTQRASPLATPAAPCATCRETEGLVEEVAGLSDRIRVEVHDFVADAALAAEMGVPRIPALVLEGRNRGRVRYFGSPAGYEFGVLAEGLADVSSGRTSLSDATRATLGALTSAAHITVLVTPT